MDRDLSIIEQKLQDLRDLRDRAEDALEHAAEVLRLESILLYN